MDLLLIPNAQFFMVYVMSVQHNYQRRNQYKGGEGYE